MEPAYSKIADAISKLARGTPPEVPRIPVGYDGAFIECLTGESCRKKGLAYKSNLNNTVEISSRYNGFDVEKFEKVIDSNRNSSIFYAVDMRVVGGGTLSMIDREFREIIRKKGYDKILFTVVLFDPLKKADIRMSTESLTDEERVNWASSYEEVERTFFDDSHNFRKNYLLSEGSMRENKHFRKIVESMA